MKKTEKDYSHIKGWGVDADPKNDPTYPIKNRTNEEHNGYNWDRPKQQPIDIEVLRSIERPNITAVFGTSMPPEGLSGKIRRYAFKYGEGSYAHWLPLVFADRVNMIEGIVDDFKDGNVPNIFAETGFGAQWKYDRERVIKKAIVTTVVVVVACKLLFRRKKKSS